MEPKADLQAMIRDLNLRHMTGVAILATLLGSRPGAAMADVQTVQVGQVRVGVVMTTNDPAALFVRDVGREIPQVLGNATTIEEKRQRLTPFLERVVDVDALARFCLGRYWAAATPAQRTRYQALFLKSLVNNVAGRMATYQGTLGSVVVQTPFARPDGTYVPTLVKGETTPEVHVAWVVETDRRPMRIIDVVAEGMSLRLAKRSDFDAYISHHDGDIGGFLDALERQTAR